MPKTQFPPEAIWIATGKALAAKHKGNGIVAEGQLIDKEGNAWSAMIDRTGLSVKLSKRERWNQGNPKVTHWLITLESFEKMLLNAEDLDVLPVTEIASPRYLYRTPDGKTCIKDFRKDPPQTVVEGFEDTERTYYLVGAA